MRLKRLGDVTVQARRTRPRQPRVIQTGATVVDVSAVFGHASSHTTLTIYAHLVGGLLDDVNNPTNAALKQP